MNKTLKTLQAIKSALQADTMRYLEQDDDYALEGDITISYGSYKADIPVELADLNQAIEECLDILIETYEAQ